MERRRRRYLIAVGAWPSGYRIDVTGGYLIVEFDNGLGIRVEPESWQISSDDHLLIGCTLRGDLIVWYPEAVS